MLTVRERIINALLQLPDVAQADIDAVVAFQHAQGISFDEAIIKKGLVS
ncbi:MAG: hypothetical protein HQL19_00285, partial [Candidatus Omnitrophica bacterium]|nr:hypothetical protein [Candidatus Omnitrophota bacterium]